MPGHFSTRVRLACGADAPPPQLTRSEPLRPGTKHRHSVWIGVVPAAVCAPDGAATPRGYRGTLGENGYGSCVGVASYGVVIQHREIFILPSVGENLANLPLTSLRSAAAETNQRKDKGVRNTWSPTPPHALG